MNNGKNKYLINEIRRDAAICLEGKNGERKGLAWIDLEDLERVKEWSWCLHQGYVNTNISGYTVGLHLFILKRIDTNDGLEVDHIDRNKLNNRKVNLRLVSHRVNLKNTNIYSNNTSGCTGVSWDKKGNCWRAAITDNKGKILRLGSFKDKEGAIAVINYAKKRFSYL